MTPTPPPFWRSQLQWSLCLFFCLFGLYFLSYRGSFTSTDEGLLLSSVESFTKEGSFRLYSVFHYQDRLQESSHEPMQIVLAAPLYWLALQVEGVGNVHLLWLFNPLVVAATVLLFYLGGLSLGYSTRSSRIAALLLATGTLLFPYTQTFFREPLAAFWLLLALLAALHFARRRDGLSGALLLGACLGALLTKSVLVTVLPGLLVALYPRRRFSWRYLLLAAAGLAGMLLLMFLLATQTSLAARRFEFGVFLERASDSNLRYFLNVQGAYWLSPGRSLWATNPVLLLSLWGAWCLWRRGAWRQAAAPLLMTALLISAYSLSSFDWHGGRGWGSRYLIPVVGVMALLLLPALEDLLARGRRGWGLVGGLGAFALLTQLGGLLLPLDTFYQEMALRFPENPLYAFYDAGTWQPQHSQWFIHLQKLPSAPFLDVAWRYAESPLLAVGLALGLLGAGLLLMGLQPRLSLRAWALALAGLLLLALGGLYVALHSIYHDPRFLGDNADLHAAVDSLHQQQESDEILYLAEPIFHDFFRNYYKSPNLLVTLPFAIGERVNEQAQPEVETVIVEEALSASSRAMLDAAAQYRRIWIVERQGPYNWWALRPAEQYLSKYFYPLQSIEVTVALRLMEFAPPMAPALVVEGWDESARAFITRYTQPVLPLEAPVHFGEYLRLTGVQVAEGPVGGILPVTLRWEVSQGYRVKVDYNVGVFLVDEGGAVVAARNGPPQNSFGYTSRWNTYLAQLDNHGLRLPEKLASGIYEVQVVLYDWRDAARLPATQNGLALPNDAAVVATLELP